MAYVVIARWIAREGSEGDVLQALRRLAGPSRAEPACRLYQPARNPANPREFLLIEAYDDEAGYQAHLGSEHFQRLALEQAIPVLERREREFFETIDEE